MSSFQRTLLLAVLLSCTLASPVPADELTREQIEQTSRVVVRIVAEQNGEPLSTGSGTLISSDGRI
jgi:hypothetical protein